MCRTPWKTSGRARGLCQESGGTSKRDGSTAGKRKNELRQKELLEKKEKYQNVFEQEYQLGYVERVFVVTEDMEDQAKKICSQFAGSFGNKKQSDLFGNLQEAYHQNRGYLLDYQITLQSLFEELDGGAVFWT